MIKYAKIARYLFVFTLIIAQALFLPHLFETLFDKGIPTPRINYSPVINKFLITEYMTEDIIRKDSDGNSISKREFESLTPFLNYRQLDYRNMMPDSINGIMIEKSKIRINNIFFQIKPSVIFSYSIPLYLAFESSSGELGLEMPDDVFRMKDSLEFIKCSTNEVEEEKSKTFTDEFRRQNFQFPAKGIYGNPTTRKPFDEGYFVVDSGGKLFHFKRIHNKPYLYNINIPEGMEIQYILVKENPLKEFYGAIISKTNKLFLISYDNYKLIELPSNGYNLRDTKIIFRGNLLTREISFFKDNYVHTIVTDRNYKIINEFKMKWETNEENTVGVLKKAIFPFRFSFTSPKNSFINLYPEFYGFQALTINLVWIVLAIVLFETKFKRRKITKILDLFLVLFTGIYGFIAVLLIRDED